MRAHSISAAACAIAFATLLHGEPAHAARNFQLKGSNELSGGIGFAADLTDWTPAGFKWFNDYSRKLTELVWLNFQLNFVLGGDRGHGGCYRDRWGYWHCDDWHGWDGYAIELGFGVKLKWRLRNIPLQFHAKIGGMIDVLFFEWGDFEGADYTGVAFGFRGGFGIRYFFVPSFGIGAELMLPTIGPAFFNHDIGAELYAAIDFNVGVEFRF